MPEGGSVMILRLARSMSKSLSNVRQGLRDELVGDPNDSVRKGGRPQSSRYALS